MDDLKKIFAASVVIGGTGFAASLGFAGLIGVADRQEPAGILEPARHWVQADDSRQQYFGPDGDAVWHFAGFIWPATVMSAVAAFGTRLALKR